MMDQRVNDEAASLKRLKLWLRLLSAGRQIENEVRGRLREGFATTLPRFDVLAILERGPAEGLTMGEMSQRLMVSGGNVTGIVERLEHDGLIRRRPAPEDRRRQVVTLTDKGRRDFAAMAAAHREWIDALLGPLEEEEVDRLMHLLARTKQTVAAGIDGRTRP